jgi:hypothetical protein
VVPQLLGVLLSLLDRLAGMQLAMTPPCITGRFTGGRAVWVWEEEGVCQQVLPEVATCMCVECWGSVMLTGLDSCHCGVRCCVVVQSM